jgi:arsenite methyltransferase
MSNYLYDPYDLNDPDLVSVIDELPFWSAPFGLKLLETVRVRKNITALDIGFGTGFPLIELAQRLGAGSTVHGIDPWDRGIARTKEKLSIYGVKNVLLHQCPAEDMPFEDGLFDLIISNNGINNVADIPQTLKECHRVSRQDAQFVFTMNTEETMIEFYRLFQEILQREGMAAEVKKMQQHIHHKRRPVAEMQTMLREAGYIPDQILYDSFHINYADGSAMFNHFLIKLAFLPAWKEIVPVEKHPSVFSAVEKRFNETAHHSGQITLTIPYATFNCHRR